MASDATVIRCWIVTSPPLSQLKKGSRSVAASPAMNIRTSASGGAPNGQRRTGNHIVDRVGDAERRRGDDQRQRSGGRGNLAAAVDAQRVCQDRALTSTASGGKKLPIRVCSMCRRRRRPFAFLTADSASAGQPPRGC